jgi:hypothetical protein
MPVTFLATSFVAGAHQQVESSEGTLGLVVRAGKPFYKLEEAAAGNVTVLAQLRNTGPGTIVVAHPSVCLPKKPKEGQTIHLEDGRSWISIEIESPDGATSVFRNSMFLFFMPHNTDHLVLRAGESTEFVLGKLGPDFALGQWVGIREPVFPREGAYQVRVTYHNEWPVAYLAEGRLMEGIWMGEVESEWITVRIE